MTDGTPNRRFWVWAGIAYVIVDLLFFGKFLLPGRFLYGGDFMTYFFPMKQFLREHVLDHGRLPLWNPYLLCGYPFIADIQVSAFYPGGILLYVWSPEQSYAATMALHVLISSMGMCLFASRMGYSRTASWIAGLVYAYNAFALRNLTVGHLTLFQTMALAPWLWGSFLRAVPQSGTRGWAWVSVLTAFIIFAGCPQNAFYALLFLLALALLAPWLDPKVTPGRSLGTFLVCVGTGFILASVQILPTFEFMSWSPRSSGIPYDAAMKGSMHPADLLNFFFPAIFGNPVDQTYWLDRQTHPFWETGSYAGILAVLAVFGFRWKSATRFERFCLILLIGSVVLALGKYNPLFRFVHALPVFNLFRGPVRLLYLAVTASAILTASLVQRIERKDPLAFRPMVWGPVLVLGAACGVFYFVSEIFHETPHLSSNEVVGRSLLVFGVLAASVVGLIGLVHARNFRPGVVSLGLSALVVLDLYGSSKFLFLETDAYRNLQANAWRLEAAVRDQGGGMYRVYQRAPRDLGNLPLLSRQSGIRGYNPIMVYPYVRFMLGIDRYGPEFEDIFGYVDLNHLNHPALRMIGMKYVVDLDPTRVRVFEDALPRAFWIRNRVWLTEDEALRAVIDPSVDPRGRLVLIGAGSAVSQDSEDTAGRMKDACRILEEGVDRLKIEVAAPAPDGYLFLSDVYYPGWKAFVDGAPAEILRANYAFRAVAVPAGTHQVEMRYSPSSLRWGAAGGVLGLILCGVYLLAGREAVRP